MSKISIIVNCRVEGNKNCGLDELLMSIQRNTIHPELVEVLIKFDTDDQEASQVVEWITSQIFKFSLAYIIEPRGRGYIDIHHGYNRLLQHINKDTLLVGAMGDDFLVLPGWDVALMDIVNARASDDIYIIHQRPHPPSRRLDIESNRFSMDFPMFDRMEELFIVDEAPFWSRELLNTITWLGGGLSFTDGWTLCLEHALWHYHRRNITHFTKETIVKRVLGEVDMPNTERWIGDRKTNFDYMRSPYFRAIVENQARNVANRFLISGRLR